MTTMKPDKTGLQGQIETLRRSNEVLRQTYLHLRDANAELMKIIDTFIETRSPDPRQGTLLMDANPQQNPWAEVRAYNFTNPLDSNAYSLKLIPFVVVREGITNCPSCGTELQHGQRVWWSGKTHEYAVCPSCINTNREQEGQVIVQPDHEEELAMQDQLAEDAGYELKKTKREGKCPNCNVELPVGSRVYVGKGTACRKCFGT